MVCIGSVVKCCVPSGVCMPLNCSALHKASTEQAGLVSDVISIAVLGERSSTNKYISDYLCPSVLPYSSSETIVKLYIYRLKTDCTENVQLSSVIFSYHIYIY